MITLLEEPLSRSSRRISKAQTDAETPPRIAHDWKASEDLTT
ncbi:hypothetical protein OK016_07455 [Vibrio chagasii]|nr:hypothetical protein [Vibrio chagasii]